jgi:hypothetical protein
MLASTSNENSAPKICIIRPRSEAPIAKTGHVDCSYKDGDFGRQTAKTLQSDTRLENQTRTGTLAVRSSLPQLTHAPLIARRIAFQMQ